MEETKSIVKLSSVDKLDNDTSKVINKILKEKDPNELKNLTQLFALAQAKKNILRSSTLNNIIDKTTEEMLARIEKHPGEFSHTDLINYLQAAQGAIDKASKLKEDLSTIQPVYNQQNNQLNIITGSELSRESKENVIDFFKKLLDKNSNVNNIKVEEDDVSSTPVEDENQTRTETVDEVKPNLLNEEE